MHKVTFYPLGNAESCLVQLESRRMLLFDYAAVGDPNEDEDDRVELESELREQLEENDRDGFDVVAFTHLDQDHVSGASEFFFLDHAAEYQSEDRVEIDTLWVPAAAIVEEGLTGDARVIRQEARYRLKEGGRIRVFSRPSVLRDWLEGEGIAVEDRDHLIIDAGNVVDGFDLTRDGLEIFVHSPFAKHGDGDELIDRNLGALVLHATFLCEDNLTRFLITSDIDSASISDIVRITRYHDRSDRLQWDIGDIPHHCSYKSLCPEKGDDVTEPIPDVAWLWEDQQAERGAILVSSSCPIPDGDTDEPPHLQAARYYDGVAPNFVVTMEYPEEDDPEPTVIEICHTGATLKKPWASGVAVITESDSPRAGPDGGS